MEGLLSTQPNPTPTPTQPCIVLVTQQTQTNILSLSTQNWIIDNDTNQSQYYFFCHWYLLAFTLGLCNLVVKYALLQFN